MEGENSPSSTPENSVNEFKEISGEILVTDEDEIVIHPLFLREHDIQGFYEKPVINHTSIVSNMVIHEGGVIPDEIINSHVTVFCPGKYDLDDLESSQHLKHILDEAGIGVLHWLSVGNPQDFRDPAYIINYEESTCKTIDGSHIIFHSGAGDAMCTNSPYWQETLIEESKEGVKFGAVGVVADEWPGTFSTVLNGGCFCEFCMEEFREYLIENSEAPHIMQALKDENITDLSNFNYKDFINNNYREIYDQVLSQPPETSEYHKIPLFTIFLDFQLQTSKDLMTRINHEIKEVNSDATFSANMANLRKQFIEVADIADFYSPELIYTFPISAKSAVDYEVGRAFGGIVNGAPSSSTLTPLMLSENATPAMKIYTAEAYSRGGIMVNGYGSVSFTGEHNHIPHEWNLDMEELYPYYDYIYFNEMMFENLYNMADVGVLYDVSYRNSFDLCMRVLIENGISSKALAVGDNNLIKMPLNLKDLEGLKLLILPGNYMMENETIDVINEFIQENGRVLSFHDVAKTTHSGENLSNEILDENHIHINERIPFVQIMAQLEPYEIPEEANLIVEYVNRLVTKQYEIDDDEIIAAYYYSSVYNAGLLHLVNYSFDYENNTNLKKQFVDIKIRNNTPFEDEEIQVFYRTPENNELVELQSDVKGDYIYFSIPEITAWGTVIFGEQARIEVVELLNNTKVEYDQSGMNDEFIEDSLESALSKIGNNEYEEAYKLLEVVSDTLQNK